MFYEIPVAKPWTPQKEYEAYKNTIEQVKLGDRMGFHSFWTVEHHFLDEYSHCSNPEVLYGHVAAVTQNMRIGYGVRLLPKPYNHPIRTAESVAVLDLVSDGRVEFGTGRSSTRAEIEGFGLDPHETRDVGRGAATHRRNLDQRRVLVRREVLADAAAARASEAVAATAPADLGATSSVDGHYEMGKRGIGLLSFTVGNPPENLEERIVNYRRGLADCSEPVGKFVNSTAATFTMVHCSDTNEKARAEAEESFVWYPRAAGHHIASLAEWMEQRGQALGNYGYAGEARKGEQAGYFDHLNMDYLYDSGAGVVGDPDRCIEICKRYEAVGCELLFCLLNPYNIPHEQVMHSIELLGTHVIPELDK